MTPAFEARDISKSFGYVHALSRVSIDLMPGEIHAIIGENGAGKSTLMNIICGKLAPTEGGLFRSGAPVAFHSPIDAQRAGIAIALPCVWALGRLVQSQLYEVKPTDPTISTSPPIATKKGATSSSLTAMPSIAVRIR